MGVTGLLPFLKKSTDQVNVSQLAGKTVAIDAYVWLHRGAFSCADRLARGEKTTGYVGYGMKMLNMLISHKIKPILVFDGRRLKAKEDTEKKRHEARKQNKQKAEEMMKAGRDNEARDLLRRSVDVNHSMALELMNAARKINVDCIVAPHEADAQLAYLNRQGIAHVVITEDSDLILFGCTQILYKLDINGNGLLVRADKLHLTLGRPLESPEDLLTKLRQMCILSGCDYVSSLPGVGLVKAKKFVMATSDPDFLKAIKRMPSYLNLRTKVDEEYIEKVARADLSFRRQLVFDPLKRQQIAVDGEDIESAPFSGTLLEPDEALQLALGNIDPHTMQTVAHFSLNNVPATSIWGGNIAVPEVTNEGAVNAFVSTKKEVFTIKEPSSTPKTKLVRPKIANRPSAWKLDLEMTELYSQRPKCSSSLKSTVQCSVEKGGQLKKEFRSSYFMKGEEPPSIECLDEEIYVCSPTKTTPEQPSLLQQIENSPQKRVADQGSISKNPFSKKNDVPPSPILNRYCLDSVKPDPLYILSPIKLSPAAKCDSVPLVADSDEGTFRDSLFNLSTDEAPSDSDTSMQKPNLSRFKFRRPLFSQSSGSTSGIGTQEELLTSPVKSPIIKRKRNENFSPYKRQLVSKYFNDSKGASRMFDDNCVEKPTDNRSFVSSTPVRSNVCLPPSTNKKNGLTRKPVRNSGGRKSGKVDTPQISLLQFGFSKN